MISTGKVEMKFYYDLLSQPSRALFIFLQMNKIPHKNLPVALRNGEHLTDEFKQNINRFQKVPCIDDNGFKLSESVAIFRYLAHENQNKFQDNWYPIDTKKRALVDEYMEWQHNNTRLTCAMYFQTKWLIPLMSGKPVNEKKLEMFKEQMEKVLDLMENTWLESKDKKFLATNEISFADVLAACEIEQTRMAEYDPFENRPRLKQWWLDVKQETNPIYDEAHEMVYKIIKSQNKKKAKL